MAPDRRALPRVLTMRDRNELGVTRSAVAHGIAAFGWRHLARGIVLTRDEEPTRDDWAVLGLELAGPRAALSGWDVLRVRGLGAPAPPSDTVLVLDRQGTNRRIGPVLIRPTRRAFGTELLAGEHPTLPWAPVVTTARAVADTALQLGSLDLVRALVTSAVQKGRCRPQHLVRELEHCPRNGSQWFRRSLHDLLGNARSIAEAEAVDLLRAARVPMFEVNVPVLDEAGTVVAVLDILWRELRAVAEIDSREFHFSEADWKRTLARHNTLGRRGLAIEHHAPSDIRRERKAWARGIVDWLETRSAELGVPYRRGDGPLPVGPDGPVPLQLPLIKKRKRTS